MKLTAYFLALSYWTQTATGFAPTVPSLQIKKSQALSATKSPEVSHTIASDDWIAEHFQEGMPDEVNDAISAMQQGAKYHVFDWFGTASLKAPTKSQQVSASSSIKNLDNFVMTPETVQAPAPVSQLRPLTAVAEKCDAAPPLEQFRPLMASAETAPVAPSIGKGASEWFSFAIGMNPDLQTSIGANQHADWFADAQPLFQPETIPRVQNFHRLVPTAKKVGDAPTFESLRTFVASAIAPPGAAVSLQGPREWFSETVSPAQPQGAPSFTKGSSDWFSQAIFSH